MGFLVRLVIGWHQSHGAPVPSEHPRGQCRAAASRARPPGRPHDRRRPFLCGQIITALGTDAPNVVGLVYIAAFGLDEGESIGALLEQGPPTPALAHLDIDPEGFSWLPEDDFVHHFAADVDPVKAKVMYAVQQPLHASALADVMGVPAWKSLPSWYLVADGDEAIPPDAERQFAARMGADTVEVASNHVAMVSHPDDAVERIVTAASAVTVAG
jgi:Alpha/beta hydrolase family